MENTNEEKMLALAQTAQYKTNHTFHLILTVLTAGVWSGFWLHATANNISKRNKIKKKYGLPTEFNLPKIIQTILGLIVLLIGFVMYKNLNN